MTNKHYGDLLDKAHNMVLEAALRPYCRLPKTSDPKRETMTTKRNKGNRNRGKEYERRVAAALGGVRNLDKGRPHTDVETETEVFEIKSTQASVPVWLASALNQLEKASAESEKRQGGVVKVYTKNKARAFLITEVPLI